MPHKDIIIHHGEITKQLSLPNLLESASSQIAIAHQLIENLIQGATSLVITDDIPCPPGIIHFNHPVLNGDVYVLRDDNTSFLRDCISPLDDITVYGAYR